MRIILSILLFFSITTSFSQPVSGPTLVQPGATANYSATLQLHPQSIVTWTADGGTVIGQSQYGCQVEWFSGNHIGSVSFSEDIYGQSGSMSVMVGDPYLTPLNQFVNYGTATGFICVNFLESGSCVWQDSPDGITFGNISGAPNNACYAPALFFPLRYYRCIVTTSSGTYYTEPVTLQLNALNAGAISMAVQPAFHSQPSITQTPATGGLCLSANYQYAWEQSVEGGPWNTIGTTAAYPGGAPAIIGNTLIRRKITCGTETLYSNTLIVTPTYTAIDFENRNYVRTYTVATRGVQSRPQADQLEVGKKFQNTAYFDGLGRTIQVVDKGISLAPNDTLNDMVLFTNYDNLGRTPFNYLPYPTADQPGKFKTSTTAQATFYSTNFGETQPWGKTEYEDNPIARIKKNIDPGAYRLTNNIGKSAEYDFNNPVSTQEKVHVWRIGYTAGALPTTSPTDIYQNGTLIKTAVLDETQKKVIEYKDFNGNIVLKKVQLENTAPNLTIEHDGWLCTYYVYDDFNRLRFIITPKAVEYLDDNSWSLSQTIADELCYSYEYDPRGRVINKKTPGIARLSMVYDQRDRPVFSQDGNQFNKSPKEWSVNFYDQLDRVVMTGLYKSNKTQAELQTDLNNAGANANITIPGEAIQNLIVSERPLVNPPATYKATETIQLVAGFESSTGDEFVAEIDPLAVYPSTVIAVTLCAVPSIDIANASIFTGLTYHYYDNYDFPGVKGFNGSYNNSQAYLPSDPDVEPIGKSVRTLNMPTGSKIRVLGSSSFLLTTIYYDEEGRVIQSLGDNYKQGIDIATSQYHFDGRLLSSHVKHYASGSEFDGFDILTKNAYDKIGRLVTLSKKYGTTGFKKIADYAYDELGHLKSKKLGKQPQTNDPLETISYSYNANGLLTGMNKDYALSTVDADQWNNYFGLYLGYENFDSKFTRARYDHLITGLIWKTQGDNTPRKYDFDYDNAGRLTKADFTQRSSPSSGTWSNAQFDFSETDIQYDLNGNLKQLYRKGVVPGNSSALYIDKLQYTYRTTGQWSNQLLKVFDNAPDIGSTGNGKLGDFKDEVWNSNTDDYTFDVNGNLVKDNNKKIRNGALNGILYNHLDKPEKIIIENGSTVEFFYDALGIKLAKKVTPQSGPAKTTYYIGELVYLENDLQFLLHEEGRVRIMTPENSVSPQGSASIETTGNAQFTATKWGVFEYFIKDHLGSVRMVLTEEYHKEIYKATMELAGQTEENQLFGKVDNSGNPTTDNEVVLTRGDQVNWNTHIKVSKLFTTSSSTTNSIGPNILLKVMAGDKLAAEAYYYYVAPTSNVSSYNILNTVVGSLIGGFAGSGASQPVKDGAGNIQTGFQNPSGPIQLFLNNRPSTPADRPKAYLNYIFFDENFNYVSTESGASRVDPVLNDYYVSKNNLRAPKNGYVFVYLSNESDWLVQFDDFKVTHERGAIIEESHYYPYGLKIAGISSRAFNKMPNKYGFQGDFSEEEGESGYDEFDLRMYDPQIGRWIQNDPYDEFASGYLGMGDDPVNSVDPDGGELFSGFGQFAATVIGAGIGYIVGNAIAQNSDNRKDGWIPAVTTLLGAALGYGVFEINWENLFGNFSSEALRFGNLDFSDLRTKNLSFFNYLISNLELITGLDLDVDSKGMLGYKRHVGLFGIWTATVARYRTNSVNGRRLLKSMIKNSISVQVLDDPGAGNHVPTLGANEIHVDELEQNVLNSGTYNGVDPNTFGAGMVFIHEHGHTGAGGAYADLRVDASGRKYDNAQGGFNERPRRLNKIRRQMSGAGRLSWGKRSTYFVYPISGKDYMGLSRKARKYLMKGKVPPSWTKYVIF